MAKSRPPVPLEWAILLSAASWPAKRGHATRLFFGAGPYCDLISRGNQLDLFENADRLILERQYAGTVFALDMALIQASRRMSSLLVTGRLRCDGDACRVFARKLERTDQRRVGFQRRARPSDGAHQRSGFYPGSLRLFAGATTAPERRVAAA